jgi:heat shock protein HslJ
MGVVWSWQSTQMRGGAVVVPESRDRYTLEFQPDGTVRVRADCNRGSATYVRSGKALSIAPPALTRMACPAGTRDAEFVRSLTEVAGHLIRGNDLVLTLKGDGGSMQFVSSRP